MSTETKTRKSDAESTIEFAVHTAIVETCCSTGLRPGLAVDELLKQIMFELKSSPTTWALKALHDELRAKQKAG